MHQLHSHRAGAFSNHWTFFLVIFQALELSGQAADWHGFARTNFSFEGRGAFVTRPATNAPGHPWVWRTSFPDFHAEVDIALLKQGFHVAYVDVLSMLGCDASLDIMDRFYAQLTNDFKLAVRPVLEGVSRGGLHAYRYAARHPERVACIYCDTPVLCLASWPLGWPGSKKETQEAIKFYGLKDEDALFAFKGNPIDLLAPIAKARIPLRHVIALDDKVVPPEENTLEAQRRLQELGHDMTVITVEHGTKESNGHHFPLPAVDESAAWIVKHATP